VTRVLPSLLLTDGSHAFSLCQNGEHRSKRSEIAGFNSNFAIALRCDAVYLTSARPRDAGSWRIGSFVLDSPHMVLIGKLPLPKWLPSCPEDVRLTIAILGACKLLNVRPGIWITGTYVATSHGHL
jgi:hypothetical protein